MLDPIQLTTSQELEILVRRWLRGLDIAEMDIPLTFSASRPTELGHRLTLLLSPRRCRPAVRNLSYTHRRPKYCLLASEDLKQFHPCTGKYTVLAAG